MESQGAAGKAGPLQGKGKASQGEDKGNAELQALLTVEQKRCAALQAENERLFSLVTSPSSQGLARIVCILALQA